MMTPMKTDTAVFGGGCFWCTEAVFDMLRGVKSVVPGYAGGKTVKPSYEAVCTGETGHAEVIKVDFDPSVITYEDLLTVFFAAHDPTTRNRQGNGGGVHRKTECGWKERRDRSGPARHILRSRAGPPPLLREEPGQSVLSAHH